MLLLLLVASAFQAPAPAPPDPNATAKAQFKEWAKLNADSVANAQKAPKVKRSRVYSNSLLKKNQEFCKKHSLSLVQLEALVMKGVKDKWPTETEVQGRLVAEAAERIVALRNQNDAVREQIILEQEVAAYIDRVSRERRSMQPRVMSASGVAGALQSAPRGLTPADVPISTCGFPLMAGGNCARKVAGGGHCYQHR